MGNETAKHEKVRFSRGERRRLERLPSAAVQPAESIVRVPAPTGWAVLAMKIGLSLAVLAVAALGAFLAVGASGMGKGRIQSAAQAALSELAGENVSAHFGDARLVLDGPSLVSLEIRQVRLASGGTEGRSVAAERLRFGLALWPLIGGRIELTGARLSDASVALGAPAATGTGDLLRRVTNDRGLIEPDLLARAALDAAGRMIADLSGRIGGEIVISNLDVDILPEHDGGEIGIGEARIADRPDGMAIALSGRSMGMDFRLSAVMDRDGAGSPSFEVAVEVPQLRFARSGSGSGTSFEASATLLLTGRTLEDGRAGVVARASLADASLVLSNGERHEGAYRLEAIFHEGSGKVEVERLVAEVGRTRLNFHGALSPSPETSSPRPVYRYELVSDGSVVAPADSPEPALSILARVAGILDPDGGRITADEIGVRTTHGEVVGNGALVFPGGRTPAAFLAIQATDLPVSHAKQLWPWRAAGGARGWVLQNVFGGTVRTSRIELSTVAGRFGDGVPFGPDEISGYFEVSDTRFNTAGDIPPVRDADGYVDFKGRSVRIGLRSGTVYLPSGRTVDGKNGTLDIAVESGKPLTGMLEVEVAGKADAITELASHDPINAGRYLDLAPEDFSGEVSGRVSGIIPLEAGIPEEHLSWNVALDYESLAIAKPFDGQVLTDATGSIRVDPGSAVIEARGRLNGLPAVFSLVEPLGDRGKEGRRDIRLELDDKARAAIAPGLNTIISGPVSVEVSHADGGRRRIEADLTQSILSFPWAGWRKGAGVPARATFDLSGEGRSIALADLDLSGEGFSISGSATIVDGAIEKAKFDRVRLNRDDQFSLAILRSGKGYRLEVAGERIDARSLVRQFMADPAAADSGLEETPVWLTARSGRVLGFGGEELSGVVIRYMGSGTRLSGLDLTATTRTGHEFLVRAGEEEGRRKVEMRSTDAGAILRFLDIYPHMEGGSIDLRLSGRIGGPLAGQLDARDFWLVNEPRLSSLVASAPAGGQPGLNEPAGGAIDVGRARFERGFARIEKGDEYLTIAEGILRGPQIGSTFQGTLYDAAGNISITGTFMPAYGLNRMFAEIPIFGLVLGNGRDRGLIGITYKLSGEAKAPKLAVNPISAIAPGIFRTIFEFR